MKHIVRTFFLFLSTTIFLTGCEWPEPQTINAQTYVDVKINIDLSKIFLSDISCGLVQKNADNPQVTMYGTVVNTTTKQPVSGVKVRIVGTDTPGGSTITRDDGSWTLPLPIVPDRNDEDVTLFAIELQKEGALMAPVSKYCDDPVVWELFHIDNPDTYMVAGAYSQNLLWGNLYLQFDNHLYITMEH